MTDRDNRCTRYDMDVPLKVGEVAKLLDCSERKVYRLIEEGYLKSIKILGTRRVTRDSLSELLSKGTEGKS